jgi:hypothetical protein
MKTGERAGMSVDPGDVYLFDPVSSATLS